MNRSAPRVIRERNASATNAPREGDELVTDVEKRERRTMLENDVASDATADRGHEGESHDADEVIFVSWLADGRDAATQRADKHAQEIEEQEERVKVVEDHGCSSRDFVIG